MTKWIYNCALFLYALCILPKILWQRIVHGKYKESLKARLGLTLPPATPILPSSHLIHTVSMGETRAAIPFFASCASDTPTCASSSLRPQRQASLRPRGPCLKQRRTSFSHSTFLDRTQISQAPQATCSSLSKDIWLTVKRSEKEKHPSLPDQCKISERSTSAFVSCPPSPKPCSRYSICFAYKMTLSAALSLT